MKTPHLPHMLTHKNKPEKTYDDKIDAKRNCIVIPVALTVSCAITLTSLIGVRGVFAQDFSLPSSCIVKQKKLDKTHKKLNAINDQIKQITSQPDSLPQQTSEKTLADALTIINEAKRNPMQPHNVECNDTQDFSRVEKQRSIEESYIHHIEDALHRVSYETPNTPESCAAVDEIKNTIAENKKQFTWQKEKYDDIIPDVYKHELITIQKDNEYKTVYNVDIPSDNNIASLTCDNPKAYDKLKKTNESLEKNIHTLDTINTYLLSLIFSYEEKEEKATPTQTIQEKGRGAGRQTATKTKTTTTTPTATTATATKLPTSAHKTSQTSTKTPEEPSPHITTTQKQEY